MNDQRGRLTDQELSDVETHLRESLALLGGLAGPEDPAALMKESLQLSLALVEELHRERALHGEPAGNGASATPAVEVEALREFVVVLLRIAQISERHWFQMAEDDRWFLDTQYKHSLMSKLGSALREFRSLMNEKGEVVKNKLVAIETSNSEGAPAPFGD